MHQEVCRQMERNPVIRAIGLLPELEFWEMLTDCDLYLIPQRMKVPTVFFPSKMLPAIAVGCPVLALTDRGSELGRFVEQHELGKVTDASDGSALAAEVELLRNDRSLRERSAKNAARIRPQFDREQIFPEFERELRRVVHSG